MVVAAFSANFNPIRMNAVIFASLRYSRRRVSGGVRRAGPQACGQVVPPLSCVPGRYALLQNDHALVKIRRFYAFKPLSIKVSTYAGGGWYFSFS